MSTFIILIVRKRDADLERAANLTIDFATGPAVVRSLFHRLTIYMASEACIRSVEYSVWDNFNRAILDFCAPHKIVCFDYLTHGSSGPLIKASQQ